MATKSRKSPTLYPNGYNLPEKKQPRALFWISSAKKDLMTMPADVIDVLSSPNIVASNADGSETWVYDKVITEQETVVGSNGSVSVRSTRTMMVVVKFDKNHVVDAVQYHQTSY